MEFTHWKTMIFHSYVSFAEGMLCFSFPLFGGFSTLEHQCVKRRLTVLLWPLDSWGEIMNPVRSPASRFYSSPFLHHGGCGPRHWNAGARGRSTAGGLPPWVPTADAKDGHGLSSFAGSLWSEILHPCGCGLSVACWCFHMFTWFF